MPGSLMHTSITRTGGVTMTVALPAVKTYPGFVPSESQYVLSGVTRDSAGAILGSCTVEMFETATDLRLATTTSDAVTGAYSFTVANPAVVYLVAYLSGSPDVAGTTVNTLRAS